MCRPECNMVSLHSVKTQNGMITTQCQDTKSDPSFEQAPWKPENRFCPDGNCWLCTENDGKSCDKHFFCSNLLVPKDHFGGLLCDTASV